MKTAFIPLLLTLGTLTPLAPTQDASKPAESRPAKPADPAGDPSGPALVKRKEILAELSTLSGHPWAGDYSFGTGYTGFSLALAPKTGAVATGGECTDPLGNFATAAIGRVDGARVYLTNVKVHSGSNEWLVSPLVCFRWGAARYAIPEAKLLAFCNLVNQGEERPLAKSLGGRVPKHVAWMKDGKPNPDLTATPEEPSPPIPEEYRKYLLSKPVKAVVTEVLQLQRVFTNNATETEVMARTKVALRVKIPAGEVLLEGHELLREGDGELAAWTVVKVEGESCTVSGASEWRVYKEGDVKSTTPEIPAAGSKLSTRWKP